MATSPTWTPPVTLTPEDLACLYVPTPDVAHLEELIESCGGTVIAADGHAADWAWAEAERIPEGPAVLKARSLGTAELRELAMRSNVLGLWFDEVDEERLLAFEDLEDDVTLLVPGRAFASGWRAGATGTIAPECLAAPEAFVAWCASFDDDLPAALDAERRMQHALEARFEPLARRRSWSKVERTAAFATAGGWSGSGLDPECVDELLGFGESLTEALATRR